MKAVFDSDILIDYLQGIEKARQEIQSYSVKCISLISWMEIMSGAENTEEEKICRSFLTQFKIVDLSRSVAEKTVRIRRDHDLKLPDAIIWATAREEQCLLVTRNTKDFPKNDRGIRIPYSI